MVIKRDSTHAHRFKVLDFVLKDNAHIDPGSCDHNVDNYVSKLDHAVIDLPHVPEREKPPRDDYNELYQALIEEFSSTTDEIGSMVVALQIKHSHQRLLPMFETCVPPRQELTRIIKLSNKALLSTPYICRTFNHVYVLMSDL